MDHRLWFFSERHLLVLCSVYYHENSQKDNSQDFTFFIATIYNFKTKIWKSGGLEINENRWANTDPSEPTYPILNDRLHLVRNELRLTNGDHYGAVYCGNELGELSFKVCDKKVQLGVEPL